MARGWETGNRWRTARRRRLWTGHAVQDRRFPGDDAPNTVGSSKALILARNCVGTLQTWGAMVVTGLDGQPATSRRGVLRALLRSVMTAVLLGIAREAI